MADSVEQLEFRRRVIEQYLPAWCASYPPPAGPFDPLNFVVHDDWSFPTPGIARWFLTAIDEGVVEATEHGGFLLGESWPDGIFDRRGSKDLHPQDRPLALRRESILEVLSGRNSCDDLAAKAKQALRVGGAVLVELVEVLDVDVVEPDERLAALP
jgi:hypothetical protein